jgi:membrane protease YdiL (CAAX protease family)
MYSIKEVLQLLLIVIVIGLPPYLIALKTFRNLKLITIIILSIIYWGGTIYTQQVIPFILILILLIVNSRNKKIMEEYEPSIVNKKFTLKDFILIAGATILIRFPIGIINIFYVLLVDLIGINVQSQEVVDIFVNSQNNMLNILIILLVVIVAPLNEEFSMRYWLFGKVLSPRAGAIIAALISSGLFTLLHYNIAGVPTFFVLGLYACYIYYRKGFWGAVTVHFIFNLSSVLLLMLTKLIIPIA